MDPRYRVYFKSIIKERIMEKQHLRSPNYIPGLNGLRCIACLSVFIYHFQQTTKLDVQWGIFNFTRLMENGNTGVSLFFILSGFLLSMPLWKKKTSKKIPSGLFKFWLRRFLRIAPAYYVCLIGLIILQKRWDHSNAVTDILLHFSFLHNLSEQSFYNLNPPFWTLAVEAQFYLILPLFLYIINRLKPFAAFILLFFSGISAYLMHYYIMTSVTTDLITWPFNPMSINPAGSVIGKSVVAHLPHFLLGVSCGWIYRYLDAKIKRGSVKTVATGCDIVIFLSLLVLLYILSTHLEARYNLPYGRYNYPVITFLLAALIVAVPFSKFSKNILETFPFRTIGIISYGIYIYHLPIQHLIERVMENFGLHLGNHWLIFGISSLLVTLATATFSYFIVEQFFLRLSNKMR